MRAGPYPAAAALRRRAARQQANGEAFAPPPRRQQRPLCEFKFSHLYCLASALAALLAVVSVGPSMNKNTFSASLFFEKETAASVTMDFSTVEGVAKAAAMGLQSKQQQQQDLVIDHHGDETTLSPPGDDYWSKGLKEWQNFFHTQQRKEEEHATAKQQKQHQMPAFLRWIVPQHDNKDNNHGGGESFENTTVNNKNKNPFLNFLLSFVDPAILHPSPSFPTDIIDKVLTSTPRLLAIANLLLAFTWLVHSAVVDMFLGTTSRTANQFGGVAATEERGWAGRERLGGFLVFKLLLISAVVVPDTLDLLILLSWYTLLSFLRSLAHLAASVTAHTLSSGQAPRRGVLRLLLFVLASDLVAAASCVALFHGAGWGMVLLLTLDCALLAVDCLMHIFKHASQAMDEGHLLVVRELEERQLALHSQRRQQQQQQQQNDSNNEEDEVVTNESEHEEQCDSDDDDDLDEEESRRLDRRMEIMETIHARRLGLLDTTVFLLQLIAYALTVGHFCHIWSLHGLQFTLIDGVLALHLHSAISAAGKKIAERRNLHRIARALDGLFEDATELDMRKASATGDVCCICLGTMSAGQVKKVGCGHLYHTHCLREVVERARSIEAARCPLCRASVVDGRQPPDGNNNTNDAQQQQQQDNAEGRNNADQRARGENVAQQQQQGLNNNNPGEHALFRFSTDSILPAWLPLPAFSFEVVRRPTVAQDAEAATDNNTNGAPPPQQAPQEGGNTNNGQQQQQQQQSFWRRLLILAGAISMSPEEEARALDQLVDMFPQYDRADLQRELRERGSAEAVVEAVLQGVFSGVARGRIENEGAQQVQDEILDNGEEEEAQGEAARLT